MLKRAFILFFLLLSGILEAKAQVPTVTGVWYFSNFLGETNTVRRFSISTDYTIPTQWGANVFPVPCSLYLNIANTPGLTNGYVIENVAVGQAYDVSISDGYREVTYTNFFQLSDSNTTVNAWNRVGVPTYFGFAYFYPLVTNFNITVTGAQTPLAQSVNAAGFSITNLYLVQANIINSQTNWSANIAGPQTNQIIGWASNLTAAATNALSPIVYQNISAFDTNGAGTNAANAILPTVTNAIVAYYASSPSNYVNFSTYSNGTNVTATNAQFNLSATGSVVSANFTTLGNNSTNYASSLTNQWSIASGNMGYRATNGFDTNGSGFFWAMTVSNVLSGQIPSTSGYVTLPAVTNVATAYYALNPSNYVNLPTYQAGTNTLWTNAQFTLTSTSSVISAQFTTLGNNSTNNVLTLSNAWAFPTGSSASVSTNRFDTNQAAFYWAMVVSNAGFISATQWVSAQIYLPASFTNFLATTNILYSNYALLSQLQSTSNSLYTASVQALGLTNSIIQAQIGSFTNQLIQWADNLFYPSSNPSMFITPQATNGLASLVTTTNLISSALQSATNNGILLSNGVAGYAFNLWQASSNQTVVAFTNANYFSATNTTAQIYAATNRVFNYVASTGGIASSLTVPDTFVLNGKTNFLASTNVIGVVGNMGGTYQSAPLSTVWTNTANSVYTILYSFPGFYLQSNGVAEYQFPIALGPGTAINGPLPAPVASFGGYSDLNGFVWRGWISSTNLAALLAAEVGVPIVGEPPWLTNSIVSGTNQMTLIGSYLTNVIVSLSVSPTNGASTNYVNQAIALALSTNQIANAPVITNALYTNQISLEPVISQNTVFIETNASGGGSTANALLTNNANAFNGFTNPVANISFGQIVVSGAQQNIGGQVNETNIGISGQTLLQFISNEYFILGSTNNKITVANGNGVGIIGGNWNLISGIGISDQNAYIFGGQSNLINGFAVGGTNVTIFGANNSVIYGYGGANNDGIVGSINSGISNQPGGLLNNDWIFGGTGNEIGNPAFTGLPNFTNNTLLGSFNYDTNNNTIMLNAGIVQQFSSGDDEIMLNAANGVFINGNLFVPGIGFTNGTGYGTTLNLASSVVTTNLTVINNMFLNNSNLIVSFVPPNTNGGGIYPWGIIPAMTWSNIPSGLATASGNFTSAGNQYTNAWGVFSTNQLDAGSVQIDFNAGMNNQVLYNFTTPVSVGGDAIVWNDTGQQVSITFEGSPDNSAWTVLGSQNLNGAPGMTNTFPPFTGQYFKWVVTNSSGIAFGNFDIPLVPNAQIYSLTTIPPAVNNGFDYISSAPAIVLNSLNGVGIGTTNIYPNALAVNGGIVAGSVGAAGAQFNSLNVGSLYLNGQPVQLGTNILSSIYATNFFDVRQDGPYLPQGGGYWTNSYGAMIVSGTNFPYTSSGVFLPTPYSSGSPYSGNGVWFATTNFTGLLASMASNSLGNLDVPWPPFYYAYNSGSPIGYWNAGGAVTNFNPSPGLGQPYYSGFVSPTGPLQPVTSPLSVISIVSPSVIVTSSNGTAIVTAHTNAPVVDYDINVVASGSGVITGVGTNTTTVVTALPYLFIGTNYDPLGTAAGLFGGIISSNQFQYSVTNLQNGVGLGDLGLTNYDIWGLGQNEIQLGTAGQISIGGDTIITESGSVDANTFAGNGGTAQFIGNGQLLTLNANNIIGGQLPLFALPVPAETNFDTRGWTNETSITAPTFYGTFVGAGNLFSNGPVPFGFNMMELNTNVLGALQVSNTMYGGVPISVSSNNIVTITNGIFTGAFSGNAGALTNVQWVNYPMTNWVGSDGTMWYSNVVTGASKGITTNLQTLETIPSGINPVTNTFVNFWPDYADWTTNINVWIFGATNIPAGQVKSHTVLNIYNSSSSTTIYAYLGGVFGLPGVSTNTLAIAPLTTQTIYFTYDKILGQTNAWDSVTLPSLSTLLSSANITVNGVASASITNSQFNTVGQTFLFSFNTNGFGELNSWNLNNGTNASSDFVATGPAGNESQGYADLGYNSGTFFGYIGSSNDWYLYGQSAPTNPGTGGNGWIGSTLTNSVLTVFGASSIAGGAYGFTNEAIFAPTNVVLNVALKENSSYIGNASGLTNFTGLTITNSSATFLSSGVAQVTASSGFLLCMMTETNLESAALTDETTHVWINIGDLDPGLTTSTKQSGGIMVNDGDTVLLTNTSTAQPTIFSSWLQGIH
jgi:hypothetical protein